MAKATKEIKITGERSLRFVDIRTGADDGRVVCFAYGGQSAAEVRLLGNLPHCTTFALTPENVAAFKELARVVEEEYKRSAG